MTILQREHSPDGILIHLEDWSCEYRQQKMQRSLYIPLHKIIFAIMAEHIPKRESCSASALTLRAQQKRKVHFSVLYPGRKIFWTISISIHRKQYAKKIS